MKGAFLGEFQELVLLAIILLDVNAYGVTISKELSRRLDRTVSRGSLHTALSRLEVKGYVQSQMGGATATRGGRRKRYYQVTSKGKTALQEAKSIRDGMWNAIPKLNWKLN